MPKTTLHDLLARNARHAASIPDEQFQLVEEHQEPAAVSVCCSDARVPQVAMWEATEPGWLFTPSTIGNQLWDVVDGELVVDGSVQYPIDHCGTNVAVVVGHTGCGAVTAALDAVEGADAGLAPGIAKWIDTLRPVVEAGLDDARVDPRSDVSLVNQLVEFNVDRQVEFLRNRGAIPDSVAVYGFVYDFQRVYGDLRGRAYLVNADGETDLAALRSLVPAAHEDHVERLLV